MFDPALRRALWWSAGAHLLLIILLSISFTFSHKRPIGANVQIVQATLISEADMNPPQPQKNQQKKRAEEKKKQRELEEQRHEEARQQQAEKLQQQAREEALAEQQRAEAEAAAEAAAAQEAIKKKALQDQKAQEVKEAKLKAEQANKRKADEARKKAEADKKRKAEDAEKKAAAEKQRKAEAEKKRQAEEAEKKAEAEKKRKAEAKKKAEADKKRKELEKLEQQMQQDLAAEMEAMESAQSAVAAGETDQWLMAIMGKVQRNLNSDSIVGKKCVLPIRVTQNGLVLSIGTGQGDSIACEESIRAIKKAEPLPMPPDEIVFKALCKGSNPCEINLFVEPER